MTRPNVYVKNMDSPKHMELKNRIKAVCVIFKLSVREFERECQLNRGNISNMTGALGSDKISKIIARYPSINLYWLLTGEGEMFLSRSEKTGSDAPGKEEPAQREEPAKAETVDRPAAHDGQLPIIEPVEVTEMPGALMMPTAAGVSEYTPYKS